MGEKGGDIGKLINSAIKFSDRLGEFANYPPVANSKAMLKDILENRSRRGYLIENIDRLNVGLLAAKGLDFEGVGHELYNYATKLHNVWNAVSSMISAPPSGNLSHEEKMAYDFYKNQGYDHNRIMGHLMGIDFKKKPYLRTLKEKKIIAQWKIASISQGDYYAKVDGLVNFVTPDCLGINDEQSDMQGKVLKRFEHKFELQCEVDFLCSFAAAVLDTWSVKSQHKKTKGGCIQYFNAKDKKKIILINP